MTTQTEANERDARRYRMMRTVLFFDEARQDEIAALLDPILGDNPTPQAFDRAMDHLLDTLKLV